MKKSVHSEIELLAGSVLIFINDFFFFYIPRSLSYLSNVIQDRDLKFPIHECAIRVGNCII